MKTTKKRLQLSQLSGCHKTIHVCVRLTEPECARALHPPRPPAPCSRACPRRSRRRARPAPRRCPTSGERAIPPPESSASHEPRAPPPDRQVTSPPFAGWPPGISLSSRPTGQQRRRALSTATRTGMAAQPSEDELVASPLRAPPSPTTSPLASATTA